MIDISTFYRRPQTVGQVGYRPARPETKENVQQPHMQPTQGDARMSQGVEGVRRAAKEREQAKLTALLHHLTIDLLRESYYSIKRSAHRADRQQQQRVYEAAAP